MRRYKTTTRYWDSSAHGSDTCSYSTNSKGALFNKLYLIKPIRSYTNCDLEKNNMFANTREYKDKGVVYCWVNNINKKCYVGSSINFSARLYKYYSIKQLYDSKSAISNALSKYGYSNFSMHILECCDKSISISREQYFIDLLCSEYNILKKAGSSLGFKHSENTLKKFKEERKVSKVTRENLSLAAKKRILTEKKNLSLARLGKKLSVTTREKISAFATNTKGVQVKVEDTKDGTTQQFTTLTAAGHALKVSRTAIKKAVVPGKLLKHRWIITYIGKT